MPVILSLVAATALQPQHVDKTLLEAWQTKDAKGQSCASCHSPDGIELVGFSDADVRRRIARHHSDVVAEKVRRLVFSRPPTERSALETRPMQPGGLILEGKSPVERDNRFLEQLFARNPKLFQPIRSLAEAETFQSEILSIDLAQLPVGIAFNRLSEDGAHGSEHASIANWFPDVAPFDVSKVNTEAMAYLENPSEATLMALDKKVVEIAKPTTAFEGLALDKYRCLLVYQHELRTDRPSTYLPSGNPFWQIAEFGRIYEEVDAETIKAPSDVAASKNMAGTLRSQMKQLRLPWYWLGWIRDPSLTKSGRMGETVRADYFCRHLELDGPYMGHEAFMLTRKLAEQDRNPLYPNHPREIQYSFFLAGTPLIEREPKEPTANKLFRQFAANSFRMSLWLLEKDLKARKKAFQPIPQLSQIGFLRQYLSEIKAPETELIERVAKLLKETGKI